MSISRGRNQNIIKAHNVSAILLELLQNKLVSRVELAKILSLSNTTITNLIAELLEEEVISEVEIPVESKRQRVGRPRRMLRLIPDARFAIGVHIGVGIFRVAITDLFAKVIHNRINHFELGSSFETVIQDIHSVITQTIDHAGIDPQRILGIGVGASGLVDTTKGVNVVAPRLKWVNVPFKELLQSYSNYPVCVDNNVRSMALGEALFGSGRDVDVLAFVYGRIGVGAGFVVNGELYRGSSAGAGEIGHTVIIPQGGEVCGCGNTGCLETLISEPVLLKEAQSIAKRNPDSILAKELKKTGKNIPIEQVFAAARGGDRETIEMIEQMSCYLGIALANLINIVNPELIIVGGMFAQGQDLILPKAEEKMRQLAFAGLGENVKIVPTKFGWQAGVIGAASLALYSFFYQPTE